MVVHKFPLMPAEGNVTRISLPNSKSLVPKILYVGEQGNRPFLWAQVPILELGKEDFPEPSAVYDIHTYGTGHEISRELFGCYIGSIQLNKASYRSPELVFHYYAVRMS